MMPLGSIAPTFRLPDTISNAMVGLDDSEATATVVAFLCNHCPFVVNIIERFAEVATDLQSKGARVIAISSNDADQYPMDSPERMKEFAETYGFTFPYLYDETQDVARAYMAACTPDIYVFDKDMRCTYRGRFDAATPGNKLPVTGNDLQAAVEATLKGLPVSEEQIPSIGCSIKWKS